MNKRLQRIILYFLSNEKHQSLPAKKLINALFLSDWKSALERDGKTISHLSWLLEDGDRVNSEDFWKALSASETFKLECKGRCINDWVVRLETTPRATKLPDREIDILDYVKKYIESSNRETDDLIKSTYPLFAYHSDNQTSLDLGELAKDYLQNVRPSIKKQAINA